MKCWCVKYITHMVYSALLPEQKGKCIDTHLYIWLGAQTQSLQSLAVLILHSQTGSFDSWLPTHQSVVLYIDETCSVLQECNNILALCEIQDNVVKMLPA